MGILQKLSCLVEKSNNFSDKIMYNQGGPSLEEDTVLSSDEEWEILKKLNFTNEKIFQMISAPSLYWERISLEDRDVDIWEVFDKDSKGIIVLFVETHIANWYCLGNEQYLV